MDNRQQITTVLGEIREKLSDELAITKRIYEATKQETKEITSLQKRQKLGKEQQNRLSSLVSKIRSITVWARKKGYEIQEHRKYALENLMKADDRFQKSHRKLNLSNLTASVLTGLLDLATGNWGALILSICSFFMEARLWRLHRGKKPITSLKVTIIAVLLSLSSTLASFTTGPLPVSLDHGDFNEWWTYTTNVISDVGLVDDEYVKEIFEDSVLIADQKGTPNLWHKLLRWYFRLEANQSAVVSPINPRTSKYRITKKHLDEFPPGTTSGQIILGLENLPLMEKYPQYELRKFLIYLYSPEGLGVDVAPYYRNVWVWKLKNYSLEDIYKDLKITSQEEKDWVAHVYQAAKKNNYFRTINKNPKIYCNQKQPTGESLKSDKFDTMFIAERCFSDIPSLEVYGNRVIGSYFASIFSLFLECLALNYFLFCLWEFHILKRKTIGKMDFLTNMVFITKLRKFSQVIDRVLGGEEKKYNTTELYENLLEELKRIVGTPSTPHIPDYHMLLWDSLYEKEELYDLQLEEEKLQESKGKKRQKQDESKKIDFSNEGDENSLNSDIEQLKQLQDVGELKIPRVVEQSILLSILLKAGYEKETTKGDHIKYIKGTETGEALFVIDSGRREFTSFEIKGWLLRPNVDYEEFYWYLCKKFSSYRSDYEKIFQTPWKTDR